jgi:hypothetical protein
MARKRKAIGEGNTSENQKKFDNLGILIEKNGKDVFWVREHFEEIVQYYLNKQKLQQDGKV